MDVTVDKFAEGLKKYFMAKDVKLDKDFIYLLREKREREIESDFIFKLSRIEVEDAIAKVLGEGVRFSEGILYNDHYFEFLVEQQNWRGPVNMFERERHVVDEGGLKINISVASINYCILFMCSLAEQKGEDVVYRVPIFSYRNTRENAMALNEVAVGIRSITLKLFSERDLSIKQARKYVNSYLFNVAYLSNAVFIIKKNVFEKERDKGRKRRVGQLFPYRQYKQELLEYYYQATAIEVPFSRYLAYYHVAEFFFQAVSEQDTYDEIRDFITRPSFSPYSKEEIGLFYEKIKKRIRTQREDGVWDEKMGLLLTLKKYVPDLEQLRTDLDSYDEECIEYYKSSKVEEFTDDGKAINFNESAETIYKCIRDRIYAVRNSIVHSKEGEKLRYEPFKHDKVLVKEIPLIRTIAEEIIINSAKNIE